MNSKTLTLALSLPAALLLGASATSGPQGPAKNAAGLKIAVVDIDAVLKTYPGAAAREEDWIKLKGSFERELQALEQELKQKELGREEYEPGTEEYMRAALDFQILRARHEELAKLGIRLVQEKQSEIKIELYGEIRRGIKQFAAQQQYDLVLRGREAMLGARRQTILDNIHVRDVLYYSAAVDVTDQLAKFLKGWDPKK